MASRDFIKGRDRSSQSLLTRRLGVANAPMRIVAKATTEQANGGF